MTSATAETEVEAATLELHEQPDAVDLAEADSEPGAKQPTYRIVCAESGDTIEYEPLVPKPLTSLKQARVRLAGVELRCTGGHHIEKINALGLWERYTGRKASGVKTTERGLEIIIPGNPQAPKPLWERLGVLVTASDFFAGCGGSSTGLESVPGIKVVLAVNHWALAIHSHEHNLQHARHDQANIAEVDPRKYPKTDIGWFSPECTNWSQAKGKPIDFDTEFMQLTMEDLLDPDSRELDPEAPAAEDAKWRSRLLMTDVVRMTMVHEYKVVIVENVTDILAWWYLPEWIQKICNIGPGYHFKRIVLNSAFANQMGEAPPQLRDRVYFMFWQKKLKKPNFAKWLRPKAWCDKHLEIVEGIYTEKPGKPRAMRHGQQYHYRCPKNAKHIVQPFVMPAKASLDLTLPAQRIADRKNPLRPNTYNRVDAGLERWGPYLLAGMAGHTFERRPGVRTWPIGQPMPSQTATNTLGMVQPVGGSWNTDAHLTDRPLRTVTGTESNALIVPVEGRDGVNARHAGEPMRAQTARHQDAVVQPVIDGLVVPLRKGNLANPAGQAPLTTVTTGDQQALVVPLRNNGRAQPADTAPLPGIVAGGTHHALVMRNNNGSGDQGCMTTPDGEPMRALTTAGHQSVLQFDGLFSYDSGRIGQLAEPLPAQTTVEGDAVISGAAAGTRLRPEDCTLRMLAVAEIRGGMGFATWFRLLGRAKRDLVKQFGNAVTPPVAAVLGAMAVEIITGIDIPVREFDPFAPLY